MSCVIGWVMRMFLVSGNFCHHRCNSCHYGVICGYLQTYFSSTNHLVWTNLIKDILSVLICFWYWQNYHFLHYIWIFIHSTSPLLIKLAIWLLYLYIKNSPFAIGSFTFMFWMNSIYCKIFKLQGKLLCISTCTRTLQSYSMNSCKFIGRFMTYFFNFLLLSSWNEMQCGKNVVDTSKPAALTSNF